MEYTFTWFIEYYSYCSHDNEEELKSPEFFVEGLERSAWSLCLYPRGMEIADKGCVSLYLERSEADEGPRRIPLKYELSLLGADGSAVVKSDCECNFENTDGYGCPRIIRVSELFNHPKLDFLAKDTLGVRCKMWINEADIRTVGQGFARTRIGVDRISFIHEVEAFSSLDLNQKNTSEIQTTSKYISVTSSIYLADSCCDRKIFLEVTPCSDEITLLKYHLFLLGEPEVVTKCGEEDNRFDDTIKDISKLKLSLTRKDILRRKSELLPDDKLTLMCECHFSTGVQYEKIEKTVYGIPPLVLNQINGDVPSIGKMLSVCPSAQDDLKELYSTQLLTDVKIKTETKSFPAHKNLLCARSPVFKAMFTTDMIEKNTDSIEVLDLENDTIEALLHFLYSDNLEIMKLDTAIELYLAGDKFVIEKLKVRCSYCLIANLSTSNAIELLLLASTHSDFNLDEAVGEFILRHKEEVFSSEEWKKFIGTHSVLLSNSMIQKYVEIN